MTTFTMSCQYTYLRDSPTIGFPAEHEGRKSFFGEPGEIEFSSPEEAWEWVGIDPNDLPADEVVEGEHPDDQYIRSYAWDLANELASTRNRDSNIVSPQVVVIDAGTGPNGFFSSSRIISRTYTVRKHD
jgi:hypothetical protein